MLTMHDLSVCVYVCALLNKLFISCHLEFFVNVETLLHGEGMLQNIKPQIVCLEMSQDYDYI